MKKIKIGVLGCADIAKRLAISAIKSTDECELVAIASMTLKKAQQFANQFNCEAIQGYENLLIKRDIDAVYIPLPTGLHYEWTVKALKNRKHVLAEKSISVDYASAKDMVETAQKNKLALFENFMFIFHSQYNFLFEKLNDGEIGEIRCFRSSFGFPPLRNDDIRYIKALGGGALLDAGVYTIKAAQFILGNNLHVNAAYLKYDAATKVDVYGGAFLSNDNGLFAEVAFGFDNYYQNNIEIWGSKGKIIAERAFTAGPGFKPKIILEKQDKRHEFILPSDNHFVNLLKEFYNSITNNNFEYQYNEILKQAELVNAVRINANKT